MKLLILLLILFISGCTPQIACTEEAMVCPDGSWTVRDSTNNCEFNPCPDKIICDYETLCPEGYNCISFPDEPHPICFISAENICSRCASNQCDYTESIPMIVECIENQLTSQECDLQGGRILNILGGDTCEENETTVGEVTGIYCSCVCCVPH